MYGEATLAGGSYRYGVYGYALGGSFHNCGIRGEAAGSYGTKYGVWGKATGGGTNYGVYGSASGGTTNYAGYFEGDVYVTGTLSKGAGSFLIDHPLDPLNKILRHNFVESPENLCLYRGKVKLDSKGEAVVKMPEYFKALTKEEATVTLTPVGKPFLVGYEWNSDFSAFTVYSEPNREVHTLFLLTTMTP